MTVSADLVPLAPEPVRARRSSYAWMFSPRADLAMILVPVLVAAVAFAVATYLGQDFRGSARAVAGWTTTFILGSSSHVLLTYLLLGARRDVLHASPHQAATVVTASIVVFGLSLTLMRLTNNNLWTAPLLEATIAVFGIHHRLSQAKGFWALYGLRGAEVGLPAPSPRERELQRIFVPLALLLVAVKWTLVGKGLDPAAPPYINVNPGDPAVLPFAATYALAAGWLVFSGVLLRCLLAVETLHVPKLIYLGTWCLVVLVALVSPTWSVILSGGIHGLEYYLLTRRMLPPVPGEKTWLGDGLSWPVMIAAMSPILLAGVVVNPWVPLHVSEDVRTWTMMLVNSVVLAHYSADAFIFRFRIPGVRKVALARLRFQRS